MYLFSKRSKSLNNAQYLKIQNLLENQYEKLKREDQHKDALKQIQDYRELLNKFGSTEDINQYLIQKKPNYNANRIYKLQKPIDILSDQQIKRLDELKYQKKDIDHIQNINKINPLIYQNLKDLSALYPQISQNDYYKDQKKLNYKSIRQFKNNNKNIDVNQSVIQFPSNFKQIQQKKTRNFNKQNKSFDVMTNSPDKQSLSNILQQSAKKILQNFLKKKKFTTRNNSQSIMQFQTDVSSIKNSNIINEEYSTEEMKINQNNLQNFQTSHSFSISEGRCQSNQSIIDHSFGSQYLHNINQLYLQSMQLTKEFNEINPVIKQEETILRKQLEKEQKNQLYQLSLEQQLVYLKDPRNKFKRKQKLPLQLRIDREYPISDCVILKK